MSLELSVLITCIENDNVIPFIIHTLYRKPKEQSKIGNLERLSTLGTQHTGRRHKQTRTPPKHRAFPGAREGYTVSYFSLWTHGQTSILYRMIQEDSGDDCNVGVLISNSGTNIYCF